MSTPVLDYKKRSTQEEYEREYRRRGMQQHLRQKTQSGGSTPRQNILSSSAPPPTVADVFEQPFYEPDGAVVFGSEPFYNDNSSDDQIQNLNSTYSEEIEVSYGERVPEVREAPRRTRSADNFGAASQQHSHRRMGNSYSPTSYEAPPTPPPPLHTADREIAERLERQLRDEQLQQELQDDELSREWVGEGIEIDSSERRRPKVRSRMWFLCQRMLCYGLTLVLILMAATIVLYFVTGRRDVKTFLSDPTGFRENDPFNKMDPTEAHLWRTSGYGLELSVINALDDSWYPYFDTALAQWDAGSPDALTLYTEYSYPESVCKPVKGKLKVCNGNYGETKWKGINKVMLERDRIYSSAARMNDFYVGGSDIHQRQFTMCHEMGHGFGLPHTDSDFNNRDLRNCMDYTNNPKNNMQPDTPNFEFLAHLYGTVDGSYVASQRAAVPDDYERYTSGGGGGGGGGGGKNKGKRIRRTRRRELYSDKIKEDGEEWPAHILAAWDAVDDVIPEGGRVLHQSEFGHAHEVDIGDGYTIQVHVLRA